MLETPTGRTSQGPSDADRVRSAIQRYPWLWLAIAAVAMLPALAANLLVSPVYEATTSVVLEPSADYVPAFRLSALPLARSLVLNQIEEIRSRSLAREIVHDLPEECRVALIAASSESHEKQIEWVRRSIRARLVKDSDVIRIQVRAEDPEFAAGVANTLTEVLQRRNLTIRQQEADALRRFLEEQVAQVASRLRGSEDSLNAFRFANQVVPLHKESEALVDRMTDIEIRLNQVGAERHALEARLASVEAEISRQEGDVRDFASATEPWLARLKENLLDLEMRYTSLSVQGYPSDHPQPLKLRREIEEMRGKIANEVVRLAEKQTVADPLARRNELILERLNLEMDLDALRAKERALAASLAHYEGEAAALPERELTQLRLIRKQQVDEKLYLMLNEKLEEARIAQAGEISNVRVIDSAHVPDRPILPRPVLNLALAVLLGVVAATGTCVAVDASRLRIHSRTDAEEGLELDVLAEIPSLHPIKTRGGNSNGQGRMNAPKPLELVDSITRRSSQAAEAFNSLAARFTYLHPGNPRRSILVASAMPGEGKTSTVLRLALAAARSGTGTVLIDADLRRPVLHRLLGLELTPGLSDLLEGQTSLSAVLRETSVPNLSFVPAGSSTIEPSRVLASPRFADVMRELTEPHRLVVIDSPPLAATCDAVAISRHVDATLIVARSGRTAVEETRWALRGFRNSGVTPLGVVLNDVNWRRVYGRASYYARLELYHKESAEERLPRSSRLKAA